MEISTGRVSQIKKSAIANLRSFIQRTTCRVTMPRPEFDSVNTIQMSLQSAEQHLHHNEAQHSYNYLVR